MHSRGTLENHLNTLLLGQTEAVGEFAGAVERAHFGPARSQRIKGFFLLLGPTGTGKTEMVNLAARFLYGEAAAAHLERFDMGEYEHPDSVLRFLGTPTQPSLLGAAIDRLNAQGGGFLLFDEIEKANRGLTKILLGFDAARVSINDGTTKDLSRLMVILTSNLGAAEAAQMQNSGYTAIRHKLQFEAEEFFGKEGVARFDSAIALNLLAYEAQVEITRGLVLKECLMQSQHLHRCVELANHDVITFLVGRGFSPDLGARNIRKTVERYIGDALRPYQFLRNQPAEEARPDVIGDRLSGTLQLVIECEQELAAWPIRRSAAMTALLGAVAA
ncbi:MAG TPA: AAA family ATPase [Opitutaceae bacterium]|nr:AAA family ATPase [Opitutaceae bacterium]